MRSAVNFSNFVAAAAVTLSYSLGFQAAASAQSESPPPKSLIAAVESHETGNFARAMREVLDAANSIHTKYTAQLAGLFPLQLGHWRIERNDDHLGSTSSIYIVRNYKNEADGREIEVTLTSDLQPRAFIDRLCHAELVNEKMRNRAKVETVRLRGNRVGYLQPMTRQAHGKKVDGLHLTACIKYDTLLSFSSDSRVPRRELEDFAAKFDIEAIEAVTQQFGDFSEHSQ